MILAPRFYARCLRATDPALARVSLSDDDLWEEVREQCVRMAIEGFRDAPRRVRDRVRDFYESVARSTTDSTQAQTRDKLLRSLVEAHRVPPSHRVRRIKRALADVGITDADGGVFRTLVRTHATMGRNAATWHRTFRDPAVWGYEYVTAEDERVRPSHRVLDGRRYPKDHRFWRMYCPPNGWNCRCLIRPVYAGTAEAKSRVYRGSVDVDPAFRWNPGVLLAHLLAT